MHMDTILGAMTLLQHARSRHPRRRHGSQRAGLLWGLRRSRRAEAQGQVSLFLSELSGHLNSLLMSWSTTYLIIHSHTRELQPAVETHSRLPFYSGFNIMASAILHFCSHHRPSPPLFVPPQRKRPSTTHHIILIQILYIPTNPLTQTFSQPASNQLTGGAAGHVCVYVHVCSRTQFSLAHTHT